MGIRGPALFAAIAIAVLSAAPHREQNMFRGEILVSGTTCHEPLHPSLNRRELLNGSQEQGMANPFPSCPSPTLGCSLVGRPVSVVAWELQCQ